MFTKSKALACFVGAWGFLNATLTNITTGDPVPQWHSVYPSGISLYTQSGYNNFIITANDTTQPEVRPRELSLPAQLTDPASRWALTLGTTRAKWYHREPFHYGYATRLGWLQLAKLV
ncbi:hypothetical protein EKO27_g5024 [Xylaria grammica]|uniref:Lipocalin-like domain-containing protein n=1 Tax=Xylaria grammica TaxID=363999 RepID=A0A439D6Q4_9PEZI|nr:hypothetical protein EKO27_g5024 [Xylaria grammica]